uniref:Nose resistant to fluoxetine protein 6 n=1 Tax=Cacopsylla melanoneura TaxID=428564 RepID=A0A8D9EWU2_9HEMI
MKFPLHPLFVFSLFIFISCENLTNFKFQTDPLKFQVKNSPRNNTDIVPQSIEATEEDFDATLNDTLGYLDPLITDKTKDFDWKNPKFKAFKFDNHKNDNTSLEKLLSILTPLINLTRFDNDTKAFEWSDEELDVDQDLLSDEDEDLGDIDLKIGSYIQKINPTNPKGKSLENHPATEKEILKPSANLTQTVSKQSEVQANVSEVVGSSSNVVNSYSDDSDEIMLGEASTLHTYRVPREASEIPRESSSPFKGTSSVIPPEPFVSRRFSVNSLRELMDFYEPLRLPGLEELEISPACKKDISVYVEALNSRIPWALKMLDASGHYGGSYYNGNTYWLGSHTLCDRIPKHSSRIPFKLGFYTARADFRFASLEPRERRQYVGVCLPFSCLESDVSEILQHSSEEGPASSERSIAISHVRSPHSYYNMLRDPLVWSLGVVTLVVLILLAAGTFLDIYLNYQDNLDLKGSKKRIFDSYNYSISKDGLPSNEMKLDVSSNDSSGGTVLETGKIIARDLLTEMLLSFSIIKNMKQICDQSVGIDTIPTVHGFRALSMAWVILGHTCIIAFKYADNMEYRHIVEEEFIFQAVNNATFSVDTFFFISGLLVSFLYFRTVAKIDVHKVTKTTGLPSDCLEFVGLVGYRFFRLTFPYLYVLLINLVSMKYFYHNSVFEPPADDHINCAKYWWRNILYINTMFPVQDMCMLWSWYLADDTQFYMLSLVLLILAVKRFKVAAISLGVFLVLSWVTTMHIAYTNNHMPNYDDPLTLFDKIYDKPWTRLGPYLIGISVGWFLYKTNCTMKMNKLTVVTGWFLSISMLSLMVFGVYGTSLHPLIAAAYSALSHSLWALALAFIVIACSTGYGGFVNTLLSNKYLIPFSRVTYCAYLVHPLVMRAMVMTRDAPVHLGKDIVVTLFIGQLVTSYLISFFVSLAFEAPMVTMLKIISPTKRRRRLQ